MYSFPNFEPVCDWPWWLKKEYACQCRRIQSLGWEDPLEEEMATDSSILAMENPMDRRASWATVYVVANELDIT